MLEKTGVSTIRKEKELEESELVKSQDLENEKCYEEWEELLQHSNQLHSFDSDTNESSILQESSIRTLEESEDLEERRGRESYYYDYSDNCEKHLMQSLSESINSSFDDNNENLRNTSVDEEREKSQRINIQSDDDASVKLKCEESNHKNDNSCNNTNYTNSEAVMLDSSKLSRNEICSKLLEIRLRLQHTLHALERMELLSSLEQAIPI